MFSETDLDIFQAEFSRKLDGDKRARFDLDRVSNLTRVHVYTEVYSHKTVHVLKKDNKTTERQTGGQKYTSHTVMHRIT